MHDKKHAISAFNKTSLALSDDVELLKKQLKMDSFNYVDIASIQAWEASLGEWPLLAEWDTWSKD
ncbi:hypothetical protein FXF61_14760 [Pseudomonas sp. C27(2019)]|uniref:BcsR/BcsP family cellulose biosynthesis protein n=1 Tax=Pseudomonas sp. C27(2019) TaxID=2604941 RepID=UPI001245560F|nr:BcsR/BcsP family cellulose biosynthesis protein [Pseudomonas sp. C27(2019)]QEY57670.1 hypothetical protein FXF61_00070 [Pseudomonas sp. C27(2019)]QEY60322.1 hypothetical protein FXF61_14760 [Pseudomonas sp. C27(2019)]